jgi:hypothetical protein
MELDQSNNPTSTAEDFPVSCREHHSIVLLISGGGVQVMYFLLLVFETGSRQVAQAGLELTVPLPSSASWCWNHRHGPLGLAKGDTLLIFINEPSLFYSSSLLFSLSCILIHLPEREGKLLLCILQRRKQRTLRVQSVVCSKTHSRQAQRQYSNAGGVAPKSMLLPGCQVQLLKRAKGWALEVEDP